MDLRNCSSLSSTSWWRVLEKTFVQRFNPNLLIQRASRNLVRGPAMWNLWPLGCFNPTMGVTSMSYHQCDRLKLMLLHVWPECPVTDVTTMCNHIQVDINKFGHRKPRSFKFPAWILKCIFKITALTSHCFLKALFIFCLRSTPESAVAFSF